MEYITLGIGLLILVKGADILIGSASKLAKKFKVPSFVVGLFIIALGTSAPEAAIGIFSGIQGTNLLTLGDVIGSNIVNITVIIGLTALIFPLMVESSVARKEMLIGILVQVIFLIMIYTSNRLSRIEAVLLLMGMLAFTAYVYIKSKRGSIATGEHTKFEEEVYEYVEEQEEILYEEAETDEIKESVLRLSVLAVVGLAGLIGGANLGVNSAVTIAHNLGLSETMIGLTVVAFGTSLPELVTCLIAVFKKEEDLAVGNIVGSNIFNILFVMGISGLIHPIVVDTGIFSDLIWMLGASLALFIPAFFLGKISRITGFIYLVIYVVYLSIKISTLGG